MDERDSPTRNQDCWAQHIREFCQVSPGPLPHFACGPGNEANINLHYRNRSGAFDLYGCHGTNINSKLLQHSVTNQAMPEGVQICIPSTAATFCDESGIA